MKDLQEQIQTKSNSLQDLYFFSQPSYTMLDAHVPHHPLSLRRDHHDPRNLLFEKEHAVLDLVALPEAYHLDKLSPIEDQGSLGSCSAFSAGNALQTLYLNQKNVDVKLSKLALY